MFLTMAARVVFLLCRHQFLTSYGQLVMASAQEVESIDPNLKSQYRQRNAQRGVVMFRETGALGGRFGDFCTTRGPLHEGTPQ